MGISPCSNVEERDNDREKDDQNEINEVVNKKITEDPILEILVNLTPNGMLKELKLFRKRYKIKKNITCQKDLIYNIKVIENIRSERLFNAKIIKRNEVMKRGIDCFKNFYDSEMKILSAFKHPNVENIIEVFYEQNKRDFIIIIVATYTSKKSLLHLMNEKISKCQKFEESEISTIIKILIETSYKMKMFNIIHRNLGPESVFFLNDKNLLSICIRNFYCAHLCTNNIMTTREVTGPLWYMAPEILKDQVYDHKVDLWSIGVIFYMLLTLENPFSEANSKDQMLELFKIRKNIKDEKELKKINISEGAISLLYKLLDDDQKSRCDIEIIINDPFIKQIHKKDKKENPFYSLVIWDVISMMTLKFKILNIPELHNLIFGLIYLLKDYFLTVDELFLLNEFYKSFDTNNDGIVEFDEIISILKQQDDFKEDDCLNYSGLLKTILSCKFRLDQTEPHLIDSFDYNFFICANIVLTLFKNFNTSTPEKIRIMFKELDDDDSGEISIEEIQSHFQNKNSNQKNSNIKSIFDKITMNIKFTKNENKRIKNIELMDEEDFNRFITFDVVDLDDFQLAHLKQIVKKDKKNSKLNSSRTNNTKSSIIC